MKKTAILWGLALCLGTAALLAGCKLDGYAETRSEQIVAIEKAKPDPRNLGAARFAFDDLGGLNTDTLQTNAYPWKVVMTAMAMDYAARNQVPLGPDVIEPMLRQYGWIMPKGVDNWPGQAQPAFDKPVGIVSGYLSRKLPRIRLEVANMGCASCHAGMSYDGQGNPTGRIWLGSSNSSRFFDGYTRAIVAALKSAKDRQAALMEAIPKVFPAVHADEIATIRKYVMPQLTDRLNQDASSEIMLAFDHGAAGLTNGIAALKMRLNAKPSLVSSHEHGYASIPDLYGRRLRSSVLYDGLYALKADQRFVERREGDFTKQDQKRLASIVAFFIVPSMGINPGKSERQAGRIHDILDWSLDYKPQPFPGPVDRERALVGSRLYAAKCQQCHGVYSPGIEQLRLVSYPNRLIQQENMETDVERWRAITDPMVKSIDRTPVAKQVNAANARGYVAPILNGVWASAPYFHNGSVPTLWHLLHPEARPQKFYVGGHKLDFDKVGIAGAADADGTYRYAAGYTPWSTPVLMDTAGPGRGNRGHERQFSELGEADKQALIEFLKLL